MRNKNKAIFGIILVVIGVILLGRSLDIFYISFGEIFRTLIPAGFIVLGIWLIIRRKKMEDRIQMNIHIGSQSPPKSDFQAEGRYYSSGKHEQAKTSPSPSLDETGRLKYNKLFGDMFIDFNNVNVQNVEVSMFLGDLELKLHGGVLADGLNRIVISSFIGDIRVFAPKDLAVFSHCSNFVGDVEVMGKRTSGLGNNIDSQTANYDSATKKLYIACNSFIGDIKLYGL